MALDHAWDLRGPCETTVPNRAPVARDRNVDIPFPGAMIALDGSDPDGDPVLFTLVRLPREGRIEILDRSLGTLFYHPPPEFERTERLFWIR